MNRKTDQIRAAWAAGDRIGALRIAARFFDRSIDTLAFKRAMDASCTHIGTRFDVRLRLKQTAIESLRDNYEAHGDITPLM